MIFKYCQKVECHIFIFWTYHYLKFRSILVFAKISGHSRLCHIADEVRNLILLLRNKTINLDTWWLSFSSFLRYCNKKLHDHGTVIPESLGKITDYGRPVRKSPSLHGRKSTTNPKFSGTAQAYFDCHIGPNFQISLIYAFIGCP